MKRCTKCGAVKPTTEFHKNRGTKDGLFTWCKVCANAKSREWIRNNPERYKANVARWRAENPEKLAPAHRNWRYRRDHGITLEDYERMLADQGGVCAICGEAPKGKAILHLDHCHDTERVRGLLCGNCNTALGLLKDDPERLRRAIQYLSEC